jgi:hypothetical protein
VTAPAASNNTSSMISIITNAKITNRVVATVLLAKVATSFGCGQSSRLSAGSEAPAPGDADSA